MSDLSVSRMDFFDIFAVVVVSVCLFVCLSVN